jgi:hypothetical protein
MVSLALREQDLLHLTNVSGSNSNSNYHHEVVTYFDRLVGTHWFWPTRPREVALVVLNPGLFENYTGLPPWQVMLVQSFWKGGRWDDGWFCQVENEPVNVTPLAGKNGE